MGVGTIFSSGAAGAPALQTERLVLRPPRFGDHAAWAALRRASAEFLKPWEPAWGPHHLAPGAFRARVRWARREIEAGRAAPWLLFQRADAAEPAGRSPTGAPPERLIGGVTLEHVRRGAAQSASLGYWLGAPFTGRGYMSEALDAVIAYAFHDLDLSRLEAATLPENRASRRLLERIGFEQAGLARAFLQIDGAWRDHTLYELFRADRAPRDQAREPGGGAAGGAAGGAGCASGSGAAGGAV